MKRKPINIWDPARVNLSYEFMNQPANPIGIFTKNEITLDQ